MPSEASSTTLDPGADSAAGSASQRAVAMTAPPLKRSQMLLFASGLIAKGIKLRGFSTFLMLFYNQVMGLPAAWVGAAIMVVLIIDGIADPTVGVVSDNTPTRWGRRHPYMYAAAVPLCLSYYLVWNPPQGWSDPALLVYMAATVIAVRVLDSLYEVPSTALVPELTSDYHQRTELISYRYLMAAAGSTLMTIYAYRVIFKKDADTPNGLLEAGAYHQYAVVASVVMLIALLTSAISTHKRIPWLPKAANQKIQPVAIARDLVSAFRNRDLWVLTGGGLFAYGAAGLNDGLSMYFNVYYWELDPKQLSLLVTAGIVAVIAATVCTPFLTHRFGKQPVAWTCFLFAPVVALTPLMLRLIGVMPANGDPLVLPIIMVEVVVSLTLFQIAQISVTSMFADLTEASQVKTGRRMEGLLTSADNFLKKTTQGIGTFISGIVLTLVAFPTGVKPGGVEQGVLDALALWYIPIYLGLYACALFGLSRYRLDKAAHQSNLEILRERELAGKAGKDAAS